MSVKSRLFIKFSENVMPVGVIKFMKIDQGGCNRDDSTSPCYVQQNGRKECPSKLDRFIWKKWPALQKKTRRDKIDVVIIVIKVKRLLRAHYELP